MQGNHFKSGLRVVEVSDQKGQATGLLEGLVEVVPDAHEVRSNSARISNWIGA